MLLWKKSRPAGGTAIRASRCRQNNPNRGSGLVVAATDFMPATAGSPWWMSTPIMTPCSRWRRGRQRAKRIGGGGEPRRGILWNEASFPYNSFILLCLAEREGFEPSIEFPLYTLSKRAPSTTRPSLRLVGFHQNSMRGARHRRMEKRCPLSHFPANPAALQEPILRGPARRTPYFHNGSTDRLVDVVDHRSSPPWHIRLARTGRFEM